MTTTDRFVAAKAMPDSGCEGHAPTVKESSERTNDDPEYQTFLCRLRNLPRMDRALTELSPL
jgi:hypothetical protein